MEFKLLIAFAIVFIIFLFLAYNIVSGNTPDKICTTYKVGNVGMQSCKAYKDATAFEKIRDRVGMWGVTLVFGALAGFLGYIVFTGQKLEDITDTMKLAKPQQTEVLINV